MSDLKYPVISISREYAAYGRTIARALALELGIPFFDKDFVKETAKKSGYTEEEVQAEGETISQGSKILNSILNNAMSYTSSHDEIFKAEAEVILELAQRPCIIVGRCSEAILRTAEIPSLNVFLHASIEDRIMHAAELPENKGRDVKHEIAKFCKEGVKSSEVEKLIHMIWFCIDGANKRMSQDVLGYIKSVTNDWKNIPVFVVFTKSYSKFEIEENIRMAKAAIEKYNHTHKKRPLNVKEIIPVVAKEYPIDDTVTVPPMGIDELASKTIAMAPEAKQIGADAIKEIDLKIKNRMANALVATATTGATAVGAIPIPIPDATILVPIQSGMLAGVAKIYGIQDKDMTNKVINTILKVGATTMAGKGLLTALKAIPGMNIAAAILNAAVAGSITLSAGEISIVLFNKVYKNEIDYKTIDWNKEIETLFNDYLPGIIEAMKTISAESNGKLDAKAIGDGLAALAKSFAKKSKGK